jgi:hypothetical protein
MNNEEELERMLFYARALGQGISFLMTKLLVEHVGTHGGDPEECMVNTRAMLDWSLACFQGAIPSQDGGALDITDEIRRKIGMILDTVEREARETLGLAPPMKDRY